MAIEKEIYKNIFVAKKKRKTNRIEKTKEP